MHISYPQRGERRTNADVGVPGDVDGQNGHLAADARQVLAHFVHRFRDVAAVLFGQDAGRPLDVGRLFLSPLKKRHESACVQLEQTRGIAREALRGEGTATKSFEMVTPKWRAFLASGFGFWNQNYSEIARHAERWPPTCFFFLGLEHQVLFFSLFCAHQDLIQHLELTIFSFVIRMLLSFRYGKLLGKKCFQQEILRYYKWRFRSIQRNVPWTFPSGKSWQTILKWNLTVSLGNDQFSSFLLKNSTMQAKTCETVVAKKMVILKMTI